MAQLSIKLSGYVQDIKESKFGQYAVISVANRKKNAQGEWETVDKTYWNITIDGQPPLKDSLYEVTGDLKVSKYKDDQGNEKVSFWVSKATFALVAKGERSAAAPKQDTPDGWGMPF